MKKMVLCAIVLLCVVIFVLQRSGSNLSFAAYETPDQNVSDVIISSPRSIPSVSHAGGQMQFITSVNSENVLPAGWQALTFNYNSPDFGEYPSLGITPGTTTPRISFIDAANGKLVVWMGGDVYKDLYIGTGVLAPSLATDSKGRPHIAWSTTAGWVNYAVFDYVTGEFIRYNVGVDADPDSPVSLAVGPDDVAHIVYYYDDGTTHALRYAKWVGGLSYWDKFHVINLISNTAGWANGWGPSIAVDSSGYPHVAFYHFQSGNLAYMKDSATGWSSSLEYVDYHGTLNIDNRTSIAVGTDGIPHISFWKKYTGLRYCTYVPVSFAWECVWADPDDRAGRYNNIALDNNNDPHISYHLYYTTAGQPDGDLNYVVKSGGVWQSPQTLDSDGDTGIDTSIAIDDQGNTHIAYYNASNELRYIFETPPVTGDLGNVGCAWGSRYCNPCAISVVESFNNLRSHGDVLSWYAAPNANPSYDPRTLTYHHHWQGVARLMADGKPYLVSTLDYKTSWLTAGLFSVVHLGSRNNQGYRFGPNRIGEVNHSWFRTSIEMVPPDRDKVVRNEPMSTSQVHPGGIQMMGDILAVPFTKATADVMFYDMADPENPVYIGSANLDGNTSKGLSTAAIAMMDDGSFILAGYSENATLDFYRSSNTPYFIDASTSWSLIDKVSVPDEVPTIGSYDWDEFQNMNFVSDCGTGQLYLVGMVNDDETAHFCSRNWPVTDWVIDAPCSATGDDLATLYEISLGQNSVSLNPVAGRQFFCNVEGDDSDYCNFDAAAGIYIDPNNQMILYATEHASDGYKESVKMKEFRPVPHQTCANYNDSYIELFKSEKPGWDFSKLIEDPATLNAYYDDLKIWGWNDKVRSVGWCAPQGYSYILYEHMNPCEGRMVKLTGKGFYQESPLSYMGGEASCLRLLPDVGLKHTVDPNLGHQWEYIVDEMQIVPVLSGGSYPAPAVATQEVRSIAVDIPPHAFAGAVDVVFENVSPPTYPIGDAVATPYGFTLSYEGDPLPGDYVFNTPVTVMITYAEEDVIGMDETSQMPWFWDPALRQWVFAHDTCPGSTWPTMDFVNNQYVFEICKFGEYAFVGWGEPLKVLVDELHDNRMTLDYSRAEAIALEEGPGAQPEWYNLWELDNAGGTVYDLEAVTSGTLTDALLQNYDVLLIPYYRDPLTLDELYAVQRFVARGGGLIMSGDCAFDNPNPELPAIYGVAFDQPCLFTPFSSWDATLDLPVDSTKEQLFGVGSVIYHWSQALSIFDEADPLLATDDQTWQDSDWSQDFDSATDQVGPFTVGATFDTGCGRFIGLGDSHFSDADLSWTDNEIFMKSIIRWAANGTPCKVPDAHVAARILVDEGHNNQLTLDWARAGELASQWGSGWIADEFILETLADGLVGAYTFERTTSSLTSDVLKDYDALVIPHHYDTLSEAEIAAVSDFVNQGGGLLIMGDAYHFSPNPELAMQYGFVFDNEGVFINEGQEGVFELPLPTDHAALAGELIYTPVWGQSLTITSAVNIMDTLFYDAWADVNHNNVRESGEEGRFNMAAAYDTGCGRVIGFGDNGFTNEVLNWTHNERAFRSMLDWLTDAQDCKRNILIDESHDNRLTMQWDRAEEIVANQGWGNSTYYILDTLVERLEDDFAIFPNLDDELTPEILDDFDAVFIPQHFETMTSSEVKAIINYVRQGGGVLFLGDAAYENPNPALSASFGFTFRNEVIFAPVPQAQPSLMMNAFQVHPSVQDLIGTSYAFKMEGGCSVELGEDAVPVLTTAGLNAWRDVDWNDTYTTGVDESGDFIIAAVYDAGCGRAAVVADDHFGRDSIWDNENHELVRELLSWISMGNDCDPIREVYLPSVIRQ